MQLRRRVLDQVGDKLGLLELYEKLGLRFALLELEKDLPFLPLRDLIALPHMVYPVFAGRPKSIKGDQVGGESPASYRDGRTERTVGRSL